MNETMICTLCPRNCGAERTAYAGKGVCGVGTLPRLARAALHMWEEPCISGTRGSGAVFFSGCNLHCAFCQNEPISHGGQGETVSVERLAEIFLEQQARGTHNINLVTPTHYIPQIMIALDMARKDIFPAVSRFVGDMSQSVLNKKNLCADIPVDAELKLIRKLSELLEQFDSYIDELQKAEDKVRSHKGDALSVSRMYCNEVLTVMNKLRRVSDEMEQLTAADYWPYPSYGRLLFTK